ncbi:MAG: ribosome maturation factor RimM, partial [Thermoanaerobaculales bacterium]|nr:ribosome maturation factor RimM [Thermoanaerobaculales bacterium]
MPSGEPGGDDRGWLIIGRAGKPHGVHGDLLVEIITDFPERLADGVRFGVGDDLRPDEFFEVHRVRYHKGRWLLSIRGIREREVVDGWRGRFLYLPEQALDDLPEGYYYEHHLTGLECRSPEGEVLGRVTGLDPGESQARLVVRNGERESLVPYVPEIVKEVDLEG